ncbi:Cfr10I/Bse634I family restriction endonuclease [Photobacterium iliopiscarium]|uniref:Cfr10I/Bse634I family restriction endonuclease n=1 Tax=Photobacterium iliopiscarium TaxID=56192 RepID=UPI001E380AD0|nr:Cfr10I/Bse634I family restriction endonuclease [Photobacterium iliopiscarium]MCD9466468.1 type II site-specific deoxyribonuclease [Photobacterium iliopiscarium]MCD9486166.1 type II site-specific deoxyribonuclease [Photobacterium iliopiscarium]MCF2243829.1 type II site-specific deoxyribonuclease [Photobacterium iliopiscarium]
MSDIITYDCNNKPVIKVVESFNHVINSVPENEWDYKDSLNLLQNTLLAENNSIKSGAFSNVRGTWFEWMVSIDSYNHWAENNHNLLLLNLPNISRFDSTSLYLPEIHGFVLDLRSKLESTLDIQMISSNPDYVIIDTTRLGQYFKREKITAVTRESLESLDNLYKNIINKCELDDIVGYFSLKTSLRPDRRLQIAHEGSLTKAIYVHLQTRSWLMDPRGIKYFGGALEMSAADIRGLKTVATHSITTVMSKPERAVDEVFTISNRTQLSNAIALMQSNINI